ncbi:MAG: glycosyltransferase [Lachnospiraceae bacterium]|nr:glycosyltransferase [Candidatus Minthocola equi]
MIDFDYTKQPGKALTNVNANKAEEPLVSVITPYYNGGKYFMQTVYSVLNQTFPFFEWLIVDDGSTDASSLALLEEVKQMDPRISLYHKENGGISSARNLGIKNSKCKYILPLDSDDLIEATYIEYCYWMIEKNPDAAWAYTDSLGFQGEEYLWHRPFSAAEEKKENLLTHCALIRKDILEQVGCYFEGPKYCNEDWLLWLNMLAHDQFPVQSCGEYLEWYRRGDSGVLSKVRTDKKVAAENNKLLKEAISKVNNPRNPVIYPVYGTTEWEKPQLSTWEKKVFSKKEKPHIVCLFPHLALGGSDKFNIDFLSGIVEKGYDVSILTTVASDNPWQQRFREITPNIFNLPNFLAPRDFAEFVSYYLKSRDADVLFVSNSYLGYYMIPWIRENFPNLPIFDYVHMEEWYWRRGGYSRISSAVSSVSERTYVCNSATQNVMTSYFGMSPERVDTVHIGVDSDYYDAKKIPAGQLYEELKIDPSRPVVLFICRLHEQKRPVLMLEIASRIREIMPEIAFVVVGDGPMGKDLAYQYDKRKLTNTVFFIGARSDPRPYYRDAKLTLICSIKEGLALTAYESCSMGVPVISADVGGQRDLIDDSVGVLLPCMQREEEILSFQYSDAEIDQYVNAIVSLLRDENLRKEKGIRCRQRIEGGFSIKRMVERFDKELQFLLNDKELKENRQKTAETLKELSPLAAELITVGLQEQEIENYLNRPIKEKMLHKAIRILKEDGFGVFFYKATHKIGGKIKSMFRFM